jgi:hypothetical protein
VKTRLGKSQMELQDRCCRRGFFTPTALLAAMCLWDAPFLTKSLLKFQHRPKLGRRIMLAVLSCLSAFRFFQTTVFTGPDRARITIDDDAGAAPYYEPLKAVACGNKRYLTERKARTAPVSQYSIGARYPTVVEVHVMPTVEGVLVEIASEASEAIKKRLSLLELEERRLREQLQATKADIKLARAATNRLPSYVPSNGPGYLCPRCYVMEGTLMPLRATRRTKVEEFLQCDQGHEIAVPYG